MRRWTLNLLTFFVAAMSGLAHAQSVFRLNAAPEVNAGFTATFVVRYTPPTNQTNMEIGLRILDPAAVDRVQGDANAGVVTSNTTSLVACVASSLTADQRWFLNVRIKILPGYTGPFRVQAYYKNAGSAINLGIADAGCGVGYPRPTLVLPAANTTVAATPMFRMTTGTPAITASYEVELFNLDTAATVTKISPATTTNSTYNFFTNAGTGSAAFANGIPPGRYQWRARVRDANNLTGPWSAYQNIICNGGFDVAGSLSIANFQSFFNAGWQTFYQAGFGGRNYWSSARQNLLNAKSVGMKLGVYAFMNFDNGATFSGSPNDQNGMWHTDRALIAAGYDNSQVDVADANLRVQNRIAARTAMNLTLYYVTADLENTFQGNVVRGTALAPAGAPMTTALKVQRMAEAVQRTRNLGFWPMIYTRNENSNTWWNQYTGSSTDFSDVPIWDSQPDLGTDWYGDHLDKTANGSTSFVPFAVYGGWTARSGKQWYIPPGTVSNPVPLGLSSDLNVWDWAIWTVTPHPLPGDTAVRYRPNSVSITRLANGSYNVAVTIENLGTVEAYAVRLDNIRLGGATLGIRQGLGRLDVGTGGAKTRTVNMASSAGLPGASVNLTFDIWTGQATTPTPVTIPVTLP
ncbi:MAG: hypothetical protein JST35_10255 [Armatimonadetes bacterium]|nr:hypothetical protein [Armatimonadota bacterium]